MRIAQVTPLTESVPPQTYGGTERVVSYLTEALVRLGHDVTIYASGDSVTTAELRACWPQSLRSDPDPRARDFVTVHEAMMQRVLAEADEFDVIHFHTGWMEFKHFKNHPTARCLTTLHGPIDVPDVNARLLRHKGYPLVSISDSQRAPLPDLNWLGTVYHGLPDTLAVADTGKRDYLAFLGRIAPDKRPDLAIEIASRAGLPLKIAAKVDRVDEEYFQTVIRPMLDRPGIEFVGEVNEADKMRFLAGARALIFPIDWEEPFGLVMIEAMACGTPTVAFRRGSVPEVLDEGQTGFIVRTLDDAVAALDRLDTFDRHVIRDVFRRRFSSSRMAQDYVRIYEGMLGHLHVPHGGTATLRQPAIYAGDHRRSVAAAAAGAAAARG